MKTSRFFIMILLSATVGMSAYAQDEAAPAEANAPEKVDMKDLEKKYWAPSDQGYTVVQDRTYTKSKKIGFSVLGGPVLTDEWSTGFDFGANISYHFNDRWGVELQTAMFSLDDNDTVESVRELNGAINHGKTKAYYGLSGRWVPFYSKMSFLGTKIVYFDMSFGLNVGMLQYEQQRISTDGGNQNQTTVAFGFDISQTYFITPKFAFRVDYTMRFYNEDVIIFNSASPGSGEESRLTDATTLNIGLTYYL